jgi:Ca2+/Na+ antiporter
MKAVDTLLGFLTLGVNRLCISAVPFLRGVALFFLIVLQPHHVSLLSSLDGSLLKNNYFVFVCLSFSLPYLTVEALGNNGDTHKQNKDGRA